MWPVVLKLNRTHLDVVDLSESDFKWVIALQSRAKIWRREIYFEILVTDQTLVTDFAVLSTDFCFWLSYRPTKILKWTTVFAWIFTVLEIGIAIHIAFLRSYTRWTTAYHRAPRCFILYRPPWMILDLNYFEMPFLWFLLIRNI